ncbi:MAG TPA: hypothetical protein VEX18_04465, partial [Polyangiaceae bacterium]|nr:hypothetical protein [Polyangiaceae bacterium]
MTKGSQWAALRSPIFGVALLVLVLNDHWLKGAGLLPGWLTGKLSDFAGLIVAPLLLVSVLRLRARGARLLCWAAVAAVFSAIKLWPSAARALEQLTGAVGLSWRIWVDPSDLLALSVLPLGWWVLRSSAAAAPAPRASWWFERVTAMLAMLACMATSNDSRKVQTSIAVVNTTHQSLELQVFRAKEPLDCEVPVADLRAGIAAGDFAFESCSTLEPLVPMPLDLDWSGDDADGEPRVPPPDSARVCDAVVLRAAGLEDTVLFWNDVPKVDVDRYGGIPRERAHVLYLEQVGEKLFAERPSVAQVWPASFSLPEAAC